MRRAILITASAITLSRARPAPGTTWYVDSSAPPGGDGRSWETAVRSIELGMNRAREGQDTVVVAEGRYAENVDIRMHPNVSLRSRNPFDPAVVANTILDGGGNGAVVSLSGHEGESCVLEGFTITNGAAPQGGGINGNGTAATIRSNIITGNRATGDESSGASGGGLYRCNGLIENNVISDNVADESHGVDPLGYPISREGNGGGLSDCAGTIRNNTIIRNMAIGLLYLGKPGIGNGLFWCNGTIENNFIADNVSETGWGAVAHSDGVIRGNTITGNKAPVLDCEGYIVGNLIFGNSGAGLYGCSGTIENNIIYANSYHGISRAGGVIRNNTICGNALAGVEGPYYTVLENCIIWGNGGDAQLSDYVVEPRYSCIQDWTGGGEGNISEEPRFVDAERGDFRLMPDSPCIDAGFNDPQVPETDIAGMHRIMFGGKSLTVDMGAYEFYINDLTRGPNPDQTTFTWSSLADKTYSIFYSSDLLTWHLATASFPSSGNTTTVWIDDGSLTGASPSLVPRRFYRTLENP